MRPPARYIDRWLKLTSQPRRITLKPTDGRRHKYYNMDQVVAQALAVYAKICGRPRREIAA